MTVFISILCLNRLHATNQCLEALFRNSGGVDYFARITNNGSTDGTREYLDRLQKPNVEIVHNEENKGFIEPNNAAFREARRRGAKYFICLNNDTQPPGNWIQQLIRPLEAFDTAALSGPDGTCGSLTRDFEGLNGMHYEYVEGSCLCAKVEKLAPWQELFSPYLDFIYGEDSDLSLRVRERGMTIHKVDLFMPHTRGETVTKQPDVLARCEMAKARNHMVLRERWGHYLAVRNFRYPIIVRRMIALGDALLITPILRAIKESNPLSDIYVETQNPYIFQGNPCVKEVGRDFGGMQGALRVNLDMAYENRPLTHIVDAYADVARGVVKGMGDVAMKTEIYPYPNDLGWAGSIRNSICNHGDRLCLIHADHDGWAGKNWPHDRFQEIIDWLSAVGWKCGLIGSKGFKVRNAANWVGMTNIPRLIALMKFANLFVGVDSFPLHCAQAMKVPVVGVFGCTSPRFILTQGSPAAGVSGTAPCAGERHRTTGALHVPCSPECINSVSVDMVKEGVTKLQYEKKKYRWDIQEDDAAVDS